MKSHLLPGSILKNCCLVAVMTKQQNIFGVIVKLYEVAVKHAPKLEE